MVENVGGEKRWTCETRGKSNSSHVPLPLLILTMSSNVSFATDSRRRRALSRRRRSNVDVSGRSGDSWRYLKE